MEFESAWLSHDQVATVETVLSTTRAVRRRLDLDRPVPRELVVHCLRLAFQAPTGFGGQGWGWVVVDDPETKRAVAEIYQASRQRAAAARVVQSTSDAATKKWDPDAGARLAANLERVPCLLIPAARITLGGSLQSTSEQATHWGSILQAVWSFMLALRTYGLGSAWTTVHLVHGERQMADLLGIPDGFVQAGLFPIAYTQGTDFKRADRRESDATIFWNAWGSVDATDASEEVGVEASSPTAK